MHSKFIVFEGIDKSGKTTQAKRLVDFLNGNGVDSVFCSEPTYENPVGLLIRDWLNGKKEIYSGEAIALLYAADRYEDLKTRAIPALNEGKNVVMDRYMFSTIVYQSALYWVSEEFIRDMHKLARKPDKVIFIDISPEESVKRAGKNPDRHENIENMKKVREGYMKLAEEEGFIVINGERNKTEIFNEILAKLGLKN